MEVESKLSQIVSSSEKLAQQVATLRNDSVDSLRLRTKLEALEAASIKLVAEIKAIRDTEAKTAEELQLQLDKVDATSQSLASR